MDVITKEIAIIDSKATGCLVRERRKAAGMTLAKLSELSGINQSYLCDLENARRDWTHEKFEAVRRALEGVVGA